MTFIDCSGAIQAAPHRMIPENTVTATALRNSKRDMEHLIAGVVPPSIGSGVLFNEASYRRTLSQREEFFHPSLMTRLR